MRTFTKTIFLFVAYLLLGIFLVQALGGMTGSFVWQCVGAGFTLGVLAYRKTKGVEVSSYRLSRREIASFFLALFLLWFTGQGLSYAILQTMGDSLFSSYQDTVLADPSLYLLLSLVIAPIAEEGIFRGFLYRTFRNAFGHPLVFAILVSLVFGLSHGTFVHLYIGFSLSLLSIICYEVTGRLFYSILLHSFHNFLAMTISSLLPVFPIFSSLPIMTILSMVFFGVLLYELYWVCYKRKVVWIYHKEEPFFPVAIEKNKENL